MSAGSTTILRYWGSHFKTRREVWGIAEEFRPLTRRGWHCHLVLEREPDDPEWMADMNRQGVKVHIIPRPARKFALMAILRIVRLCLWTNPDVFICENIHDSPLIAATVARVRVRLWIKRSMNSDFERGGRPSLKDRLAPSVRLSCVLATRVIAVSSAVRDELVEIGIPKNKILVRLNPRRLCYNRSGITKEDARRSIGLANSDVVWTSVGHAVPVKGWDMLLTAFDRVARLNARAHLLLVGGLDRPEEKQTAALLRSEIERLGLSGRVTLTGHVEDVASLLKASDGFVMSSHSEGFSVALIEALEAGLPCVATRVGVAPDVVQHGVNGMLVERFNSVEMSAALLALTSDDLTRKQMARNAVAPDVIPTLEEYSLRIAEDLEDMLEMTP